MRTSSRCRVFMPRNSQGAEMTDKKWGFDTLQIHAVQTPDSDY